MVLLSSKNFWYDEQDECLIDVQCALNSHFHKFLGDIPFIGDLAISFIVKSLQLHLLALLLTYLHALN